MTLLSSTLCKVLSTQKTVLKPFDRNSFFIYGLRMTMKFVNILFLASKLRWYTRFAFLQPFVSQTWERNDRAAFLSFRQKNGDSNSSNLVSLSDHLKLLSPITFLFRSTELQEFKNYVYSNSFFLSKC